MKLINTFALIAGAMVITTEAVQLSSYEVSNAELDEVTEEVLRVLDEDGDGKLSKKEFKGYVK